MESINFMPRDVRSLRGEPQVRAAPAVKWELQDVAEDQKQLRERSEDGITGFVYFMRCNDPQNTMT